MNCKIEVTPDFARELKQLAKRYTSMKDDYRDFMDSNSRDCLLLVEAEWHNGNYKKNSCEEN